MRDKISIVPKTNFWVVLIVFALSFACAREPQDPPSNGSNGDGQQDTSSQSSTVYQERPAKRGAQQILTGVITDEGKGLYLSPKKPGSWILVEEDPDADCGGRGPLEPGCEKMYFDITGKTDVFQQAKSARKTMVSAGKLKKGTRVSADYTGYDVAASYPSQTDARVVKILRSP